MDFLTNNAVTFGYDSLDEAFPACTPNVRPTGSRILLQIKSPKKKTRGGIILTDEVRETDHYNTQVAKVLAVGPIAFHHRQSGLPWPEGDWCAPGEFVRVPKYGGDRWQIKADNGEDQVVLVIFDDLNITAKVEDPLSMVAFL